MNPAHLDSADAFQSGAEIIYRSFMVPMLGRYFSHGGSTASGLRAKADTADKAD